MLWINRQHLSYRSYGQVNGVVLKKNINCCQNWAMPQIKMAVLDIMILITVFPYHRLAQIRSCMIALQQYHKLKVPCILQQLVVSFYDLIYFKFFFGFCIKGCLLDINYCICIKNIEMGHKPGRYHIKHIFNQYRFGFFGVFL